MRKPCQSPGRMKNSSYYIAPVGVRTHDLPHTVASNMVKVCHALNHSATEAVAIYGVAPEELVLVTSLPPALLSSAALWMAESPRFKPFDTWSRVILCTLLSCLVLL